MVGGELLRGGHENNDGARGRDRGVRISFKCDFSSKS
jgi:hypothetical protein